MCVVSDGNKSILFISVPHGLLLDLLLVCLSLQSEVTPLTDPSWVEIAELWDCRRKTAAL